MAPISTETDALLTPRRQRTRERLIDAAYDVFAEEGVHASTVEQVCERAGFTRGAFYSNFTSKEELFAALMERQQDILLSALATKVDALGPHLEKVTTPLDEDGLGELLLDFFIGPMDDRTWCLIDHEFRLMSLRDPEVAIVFRTHQEQFETSLIAIVQRALDSVGRTFVVPTGVGVRVLGSLYQDMLQRGIRDGHSVRDQEDARTTMARLVLAITRPV
ncbi:MAG TPA: TetR/AcrR family transcriptional regulator [Cellulomonadaceae bacterium]|nr:TetR/AcrR family transcriptional regulator [Cellulomonadaceae bacterium]